MTAEEIRLECLKLAFARTNDAESTLRLANAFYAFASGEKVMSLRERIDAALETAGVR